jgi:hypothetical protein
MYLEERRWRRAPSHPLVTLCYKRRVWHEIGTNSGVAQPETACIGTAAAPRLDDRLRARIDAAGADVTAAELTRQLGELAWSLGLARPSYQRVRVLLATRRPPHAAVATPAPGAVHYVLRTLDFLYQYPAPGMRDWYLRYIHGGG